MGLQQGKFGKGLMVKVDGKVLVGPNTNHEHVEGDTKNKKYYLVALKF